jgi:WXG100 family type VII secretion target
MPALIIEVRYRELENTALLFEHYRDALRKLQTALQTCETPLKQGSWQADAADSFYLSMMREIYPALARTTQALDHASSTTRTISRIYQQAERNACDCLGSAAPASNGLMNAIVSAFSKTLNDSQTPDKLFQLIGNFGGLGDITKIFDASANTIYEGSSLLKTLDKDGVSIDSASNWVFEGLADKGVEALFDIAGEGVGTLVMKVNDAIQLEGSLVADFNVLTRNLAFGDDVTSHPYQIATDAINNYRNIFDNANLHTPIKSLAALATDVFVKPVENQVSRLWGDFQKGDYQGMMQEASNLTQTFTIGPGAGAISEALRDPSYARATLTDAAGFLGDASDFVRNVPRLITATPQLVTNMSFALGEKYLSIAPMSAETSSALIQDAESLRDVANKGFMAVDVMNSPTLVFGNQDFGNLSREVVGKLFDAIGVK